MKVKLLGHTQLNKLFQMGDLNGLVSEVADMSVHDGQVISLAAIRQCYSHKTALEVLETESEKYFGDKGKEGKRLMNHIVKSGHTSTLEHISFTFTIEGVSRALLAQLTRHRQLSFSVQSQRYNNFSSSSRSGGFENVVPESVKNNKNKISLELNSGLKEDITTERYFDLAMQEIQSIYDKLIELGVPQEDARSVLPNASTCNLVTSGNLRAWLEFYKKRKKGEGAQHEITVLAELIKNEIINVEPWTRGYFEI